ncbi:hypothetical protein L1987_18223 [Smallanthus sonchifolius]|uniref:Uncharacterized protein n=1 Tax=Smallanthus sonchifolius TaxID=185202 RepID=A0ACB9J1A1_9ASTR|nr:hypothetical protein L1987_18223 [Smallanthus sonchifolius]
MVMETQYSFNSQRNQDQDLNEWGVKARMISRDNTMSRRFSASHITSFRDDASKSFRSNFTISSTASSPGYPIKDEIDPSTYSFTNALKALQMRSINTWEYLSPDGFALNSKWNEAERYICNPLSGEVPMECLSSKTLMNGRSFRNITNRMTMSAPLIHHSSRMQPQKLANIHPIQDEHEAKENKIEGRLIMTMMTKRDVGIQSTVSESSPSPTSTPSIHERSINFNLNFESSTSSSKSESESKSKLVFKEKDVGGEEETKQDDEDEMKRYGCMCKQKSGCLSLKNFWPRKNN